MYSVVGAFIFTYRGIWTCKPLTSPYRRCSHCIATLLPSPAHSTCKTASTADVSGGTRLHYGHQPALHHRPASKRRFLNDAGSHLCVFPHKLIPRAFTTTTARLMALPSSLTDSCLLASPGMTPGTHAWCFVVTHVTQPLVAGHRRRTSNTCGVKHRPVVRGTSPGWHRPDTLRHACRTISTVRSASWRLQVFQSSSWSSSIRPRVPVVTYASSHASTPK
jgi:hypothetical protein